MRFLLANGARQELMEAARSALDKSVGRLGPRCKRIDEVDPPKPLARMARRTARYWLLVTAFADPHTVRRGQVCNGRAAIASASFIKTWCHTARWRER